MNGNIFQNVDFDPDVNIAAKLKKRHIAIESCEQELYNSCSVSKMRSRISIRGSVRAAVGLTQAEFSRKGLK